MNTAERARLIEQVMQDQREFLHRVRGAGGRPLLAELDLTMAQLKALFTIAESGPLPVGGLGAVLGIGKPAATLLVAALVQRELVVRREDPDDRRRTLVQLSARGQEFLDDLRQGRREEIARWIGQLDDGDLAALAQGLRALAAIASANSPARPA